MLDALTFALFNKPFRKINKSQFINTTNERDCVVEIEFSVNSRDYWFVVVSNQIYLILKSMVIHYIKRLMIVLIKKY